jgi:hypothetical protein
MCDPFTPIGRFGRIVVLLNLCVTNLVHAVVLLLRFSAV